MRWSDCTRWLSDAVGTPAAFTLTVGLLHLWVVAGFWFGFSDVLYQFVGSNAMSAVSLLLLILLQASQNRETAATQAKLDELIRASAARNDLVGVERLSDDELVLVRRHIEAMARAESDRRVDQAEDRKEQAGASDKVHKLVHHGVAPKKRR